MYTGVKNREATCIQSQATINRLASFVFSESSEGSGFAILHLDEQIEHSGNLSLLRFNERFLKLIVAESDGP